MQSESVFYSSECCRAFICERAIFKLANLRDQPTATLGFILRGSFRHPPQIGMKFNDDDVIPMRFFDLSLQNCTFTFDRPQL